MTAKKNIFVSIDDTGCQADVSVFLEGHNLKNYEKSEKWETDRENIASRIDGYAIETSFLTKESGTNRIGLKMVAPTKHEPLYEMAENILLAVLEADWLDNSSESSSDL